MNDLQVLRSLNWKLRLKIHLIEENSPRLRGEVSGDISRDIFHLELYYDQERFSFKWKKKRRRSGRELSGGENRTGRVFKVG
jgi:hypothetical protein